MASSVVLNDTLWSVLSYIPLALGVLAGFVLAASWTQRGWSPHCRRCNHDLRVNIDALNCPECGTALDSPGAVASGTRRVRWSALVAGLIVATLAGLMMPRAPLNISRCRALVARLIPNSELLGQRQNAKISLWRNEISRRVQSGDRRFVAAVIDDLTSGAASGGSPFDVMRELDRNSLLTPEDHASVITSLLEGLEANRVPPAQAVAAIGLFGQGADDPYLRAFVSRASVADRLVELRVSPEQVTERSMVNISAVSKNPAVRIDVDRVAFRAVGGSEWTDIDPERIRRTTGWTQSIQWRRDLPPPGDYEIRCDMHVSLDAPDDHSAPVATSAITSIAKMTRIDSATLPLTPRAGAEARDEIEPLLKQVRLEISSEGDFVSAMVQRSMASRGKSRTKSELALVGDVEVGQDGTWWSIGSVQMAGGWSGFSGDAAETKKLTLDPAKPFTMRIKPSEAKARLYAEQVREYFNEPIELHFPDAKSAPDSITWLKDGEKR